MARMARAMPLAPVRRYVEEERVYIGNRLRLVANLHLDQPISPPRHQAEVGRNRVVGKDKG